MKLFEEKTEVEDASVILSKLFTEFHEVENRPASPFISPSSLSCQVGLAWKLTGKPTTPQKESFQSRSFADAGSDRHARIQEFLSKTPYWVDIETYIKERGLNLQVLAHDGYEVLLYSPEYQARFRLDGMLFINGCYYVLEIKTERQAENSRRTGAADKHQKQGISYTMLLQTNRIAWVYEGRDFLEQKVFVQYVTQEEKEEISKYIKFAIENKDKPELLSKDEKSCSYCQFKNYCKMYFKELAKREVLNGLIRTN